MSIGDGYEIEPMDWEYDSICKNNIRILKDFEINLESILLGNTHTHKHIHTHTNTITHRDTDTHSHTKMRDEIVII